MRSCRDDAETLILLDEVVIVEKRMDIIEAQNRRKVEPWVGVVAGSNIVEHAERFIPTCLRSFNLGDE